MNYTQNEKIEQVTDSTMVVGVDIGSQIHYARAFDNRGRELTKRIFSFHNDLEGFNSFNLGQRHLRLRIKDCSSDRLRANRSLLVCVCEVCK